MTISEMHNEFKLGVDKIDSQAYANILPEEIDVFLNTAIEQFIAQRMTGSNPKKESVEETQKRTDDLRNITKNYSTTSFTANSDNKTNGKFVAMPSDYRHALQEEAEIIYQDCNSAVVTSGNIVLSTASVPKYYLVTSGSITYEGTTYTALTFFQSSTSETTTSTTFTGTGTVYSATSKVIPVKPNSHDRYNRIKNDPFNKPDDTEVLRLAYEEVSSSEASELITDGSFVIRTYYMRYLRNPASVRYGIVYSTPTSNINCDLHSATHKEIVSMAVNSALEDIASPRYQTNTVELNKIE